MLTTTTIPLEEDLSALPREVSTSPLEAWGANQIIGNISSDPRVCVSQYKNSFLVSDHTSVCVWFLKWKSLTYLLLSSLIFFVVVRLAICFTIIWNFWEVSSLGLCWNLLQYCQTLPGQYSWNRQIKRFPTLRSSAFIQLDCWASTLLSFYNTCKTTECFESMRASWPIKLPTRFLTLGFTESQRTSPTYLNSSPSMAGSHGFMDFSHCLLCTFAMLLMVWWFRNVFFYRVLKSAKVP